MSRRAFLGGCAVAAAGAWLGTSGQFSARFVRGWISDCTRSIAQPLKPKLADWNPNSITACWIGHATVLVNFYGTTILTDPVLFDAVGADLGICTLGRKRLVAPALTAEEMPAVDLVLLSHAHMDHMDFPSLRALGKSSAIISAARTLDLIGPLGVNSSTELGWGQSTMVRSGAGDLKITAIEVKHWGARWKTDKYRGYNGYLLEKDGKSILFGGDTAYSATFRGLAKSKPLLSIMPIGSYGSRSGNHCTPEEAVRMLDEAGSQFVLPIHHQTFAIGREPLTEPLQRLEAAIEPERIALRNVGETWSSGG